MTLHVVQLEDEYLLRDILKCTIEAYDPRIILTQFADSDTIVDYLQGNTIPIDLFMIDIRVPGSMDGMGVVKKIREMGFTARILLTSGYRRPAEDWYTPLACDWAGKPWSAVDLIERLQQIARNKVKAS
jgi:YesN/AraC family two-component response regulator